MNSADRPVLVMLAAGLAKRYGGCKPLAPVGLGGEAVIDVNASDALDAGFGDIVVVVGPATGPAIDYHIRRTWPPSVHVVTPLQAVPLGTAHAALCARHTVGDRAFALVNADDIYGAEALGILAAHLGGGGGPANVLYRLTDTVVTADPVTRGTCAVTQGWLASITERRKVTRRHDGSFVAEDGLEPRLLEPSVPVSMNLWGLDDTIWGLLESAVRAVHPGVDGDGAIEGAPASDAEVLLPEVVGRALTDGALDVRALQGPGRCIGVTHADDLPAVRDELSAMVGAGERAEGLWGDRG